ncbi:glucose dehydrogenase [Halobacteriales archaeon QS_1_68_20]|nr:MAG: glucose dehydrogenase [Halobacteriales archaeon QS_1_68_20]
MPRKPSRRRVLASVAGAGATALAGCLGLFDEDPPGVENEIPTPSRDFSPVEDWSAPTDVPAFDPSTTALVENLEVPWDISVARNGDLFVTERVGRVRRFSGGDLQDVLAPDDAIDAGSVPAGHDQQPWWVDGGEGGTLGIAVHPDHPDVPYIFVYYTADGDEKVNRVSRFDVSADDPAETEEVLIDDIPAGKIHNGGRLEFGPRGDLWVTTGEAGDGSLSADPQSLAGKILRIDVNGEPSPDNPDVGDADPRMYSYGHRNPQSVVWLPDGTVLTNEHGPKGHDEVMRPVAGADHGWPSVRTGEGYRDADGVQPPLANTGNDTWAPSGAVFYTGDAVPSWQNRMVIGCLISQQVMVATVTPQGDELPPVKWGQRFDADWLDDSYTLSAHPALQNELGRVRHLEQGLDGELYAITSNRDGRASDGFPTERDDVLVRIEG